MIQAIHSYHIIFDVFSAHLCYRSCSSDILNGWFLIIFPTASDYIVTWLSSHWLSLGRSLTMAFRLEPSPPTKSQVMRGRSLLWGYWRKASFRKYGPVLYRVAGSLGQRGSLEARDQILGSDVAVANSLNCLYGITGHGRPYLCSKDTAKGKKCLERCHRGISRIRELVSAIFRESRTPSGPHCAWDSSPSGPPRWSWGMESSWQTRRRCSPALPSPLWSPWPGTGTALRTWSSLRGAGREMAFGRLDLGRADSELR